LQPDELKARLDGLLAFALTPFTADFRVNREALCAHIELLLESNCAAVFPACGLGEFFSLDQDEYCDVVEWSVQQVAGRTPVIAGVGYGTALARRYAVLAQEAGADGVLVLPPYLVDAPQDGLVTHYRAVADAVKIGVVMYQRSGTVFEPRTVAEICNSENVIGFKDGRGELERLLRIRALLGDRLIYLNGMPTAEVHAGSMAACGAVSYSSAILTFIPEVAVEFHAAYRVQDSSTWRALLDGAVLPFAGIRGRVPGYAVSLVKAGARIRGMQVGSVRSPLSDPRPEDINDLVDLLGALGLNSPLSAAPPPLDDTRP
jgi:5-dehydro-4-deoxyglucarate dehydratase